MFAWERVIITHDGVGRNPSFSFLPSWLIQLHSPPPTPPVVQSKVVHVLNCESVIQTLSCDLMSVFHPDKWMLSSFSVFFWCRNDKWCKFTIQHRPLSVWVTDWYWRCVCRLEIYHGSPRALYFMDEPIECKLFFSNSLSLSPFCLPKAIQSLWSI